MGHVIAFVPATGGVGASTLGAAVAVRAAAAERTTCAVDLDLLTGRTEVVFGAEREPGWRWDRLGRVEGIVDGRALAGRLPSARGVALLSHGSTGGLGEVGETGEKGTVAARVDRLVDVVTGLARAHDVTVLDLPRDDRILRAALALCDAVVLVLGSQPTQIASGARTVALLRGLADVGTPGAPRLEPWVVLRGARNDADLEDVVMDELDVSVVDFLRDDARCVDDLVRGTPPGVRGRGPVTEVADRLLLRLVGVERAA
ncbi:MAG: hypothetical protein ABIS35_07735 [Terracoccus sp.]